MLVHRIVVVCWISILIPGATSLAETITEDFTTNPTISRGWVDHITDPLDTNLWWTNGYVRSNDISRELEDAFYVPLSQNYTHASALSAKFSINLLQDHIASGENFRVGFFNKDEWFLGGIPDAYDAENTVDAKFSKNGSDPLHKGSLRASCLPDDCDYLTERRESAEQYFSDADGAHYFLLTYTPRMGANGAGLVVVKMYTDNTYVTEVFSAVADLEVGDTLNVNAFGIFTGHMTSNSGAMRPVLDNVEIEMTLVPEPVCGDSLHPIPVGDVTGPEDVPDCIVDVWDLDAITSSWLDCTAPEPESTQITGSIQDDPDPAKTGIQVGMFADAGHGASCVLPAYAPSDYINDMAMDLTTAVGLNIDIALSVGDVLLDSDIGVDSDPSQCAMTYQQFMENMNLPFFQTLGNHDICNYGRFEVGEDWSANPYLLIKHVLNETEINTPTYAVSKNNILFLIVGDKGSNYKLHNTQYEWLEYMTSRYPDQTTVIVTHQGIWGTTPSVRTSGEAEYTWYDNSPWWAAFFNNNPQVKVFVHGHNHEYGWVIQDHISSEKCVLGHGLGQATPHNIGHSIAFIEAPTHHKNQGPHNVNQFLVFDISSAAIEWRLWKHDGGGAGFWSDPGVMVPPSNKNWDTLTSYDPNAEDWYSFPVFLQDGETQIIDSKVFAENITLELIGAEKRELFTNPDLDYYTYYVLLGFVGFTGEDASLSYDDGVMRVAGGPGESIEFPSRYPDLRPWDGGKSGQIKNWFSHGSVPQLVPGAEYEITVTAKASQPAAFTVNVKSTDWTNQNQYEILSSSESTVIDVTVDETLQTYSGTYTAPNDPNVWFITGECTFFSSANYEIHSFSIKRVGTSDVSENYRLRINNQWYESTGDLEKFQYQQFVISPENIADGNGKINFLSDVDGSRSGMARVIYQNPVFVRGGLIKINSFSNGNFDVTVAADVSSDNWKDLPLKLLPLDNEVTFSIDTSGFESAISPNGRVYGFGKSQGVCGDSLHPHPTGDVTGPEGDPDCMVNMLDFAAMSSSWLVCTAPECD